MSRKLALLIANSAYDDRAIAQLVTPEVDVDALASVLRDPEVGQFDDVQSLINEATPVVRRAIARFFDKKKRGQVCSGWQWR